MTRRLIRVACGSLAVATFLIACSAVLAAPPEGMKIEVVGLQISKPLPMKPKKDERFPQMPSGSMFGPPGTTIHFFLTDAKRDVLDVEDDGWKVSVTDDKGIDLAATEDNDKRRFRFNGSPVSIRDAKHHGGKILELDVPNRPSSGAGKVILRGDVDLRCGIGEEVVELKGVALKAKTPVTAGPAVFAIEKAEEQDFGDVKFVLHLKSNKPFDVIREIEFLDADGKPVEHEGMGTSKFSFAGKTQYSRSIGLHKKVDKATLRIKHYESIETVKLPLDMEIDVGF